MNPRAWLVARKRRALVRELDATYVSINLLRFKAADLENAIRDRDAAAPLEASYPPGWLDLAAVIFFVTCAAVGAALLFRGYV